MRIRLVRQRLFGAREFLAILFAEAVRTEAVDQEFDARLGALGAVRIFVVQGHQRFQREQQFVLGNEFLDHDRLVRLVAQTAAGLHHESLLSVAADRHHAGIVQQRLRAIRLAAGEADLELARQLLGERVAQEMLHRAIQVRADIRVFARAYARQRAGRHVAHGVAARLARGQPGLRQATHRVRRLTPAERSGSGSTGAW